MGTFTSVLSIVVSIRFASSRSIKIQNPGFENEVSMDANTFAYGVNIIPYWQPHAENSVTQFYSFGLTNPSKSTLFTSDNAPDGSIIAHLIQAEDQDIGNGEISISQQLNEKLVAGSSYSVKVMVGNPHSNAFFTYRQYNQWGSMYWYTDREGEFVNCEGFPGYRIDLLAGDSVIAQDNNTAEIGDGQWLPIGIVAGPFGPDYPLIGEILTIRLVHLNANKGKSVVFDNVKMAVTTSSPTESPSTQPTKQPTFSPTQFPTKQPTDFPSLSPSSNPTTGPTFTPISTPSFSPSSAPTDGATSNPRPSLTFVYPTNPTSEPPTIQQGASANPPAEKSHNDHMGKLVIALIAVAVSFFLLSIVMCVGFYVLYNKKQKNGVDENMAIEMVSQDTMVPTSNSNTIKSEVNELERWLNEIDCGEYFELFAKNGFDRQMASLYELNDNDLLQIGVELMGHRKLILGKIKVLSAGNNEITTNQVTSQTIGHAEMNLEIVEEGDDVNDDDANSDKEGNVTGLDNIIDIAPGSIQKKQESDEQMY